MRASGLFQRVAAVAYAAVFAVAMARAETYTWNAGSGAWSTPENWLPNGTPGAGDAVVLPAPAQASDSYVVTADAAINVKSLTVGSDDAADGCTATFESQTLGTNVVSGNLTVLAGGVMTHTAFSTTANTVDEQDRALIFFVKGDATIDRNGSFNVRHRGFAKTKGPGGTSDSNIPVAYAGSVPGVTKAVYGSPLFPAVGGSGSPNSAGGGVIRLDVKGALTINGEILADNQMSASYSPVGASGGSVWITAHTLAGSGLVSVVGEATSQLRIKRGGCGGRIAVYVEESSDKPFGDVRFEAYGGNAPSHITDKYDGAAGTVYQCVGPDLRGGTLVIDNTGRVDFSSTANYVTELDAASMQDTEEFGSIVVRNGGQLRIADGTHVKIRGDLTCAGGTLLSAASGVIEFVDASKVSYLSGSVACGGFVCTTPGKSIKFGTGKNDAVSVVAGGSVTLVGTPESQLSLTGEEDGKAWKFILDSNVASVSVQCVSVGWADSSAGKGVTAFSSDDLGNNKNWGFSEPILPGDPIVWNGSVSSDWNLGDNWTDKNDGHRAPEATDTMTIPSGCAHDPVVFANVCLSNLTVESGATLTMKGAHLTVSGNLVVNGILKSEGADVVTCTANVTFGAPTAFVPGLSKVVLSGDGNQTLSANGASFYLLSVEKAGGTLAVVGDFAADLLQATAGPTISVDPGAVVSVSGLNLDGLSGALSLVGATQGESWKLVLDKAQGSRQLVRGVSVRDCDASDGAQILASGSTDLKNNVGWSFDASAPSVWTGGAGTADFATPGNWSPEGVPGATSRVVLLGGAAVDISSAASVGSISVSLDGVAASMSVNAALNIAGDLEAGANAQMTLNKPVEVGGNVHFAAGAKATHDAQPGSEAVNGVDITVVGDLTLSVGSTIDASGKGFSGTKGPVSSSHGGTASASGACYGSVFAPVTCGSANSSAASSGGGRVRLAVRGSVVIDGSILADGGSCSGDAPASSAGGSIWISGATISGSGRLSACGAAVDGRVTNVGGAGGRISMCGLSDFTGTYDASPSISTGYRPQWDPVAGVGSIYLQDEGSGQHEGTILFKSSRSDTYAYVDHNLTYETQLPMADDGRVSNYKNAKIVCDNGARVRILKSMTVRDLDIVGKNARIDVGTNTLTVMSREHKKGKDWADALEKIVVTATDPTTGVKGKIVWASGMALIIR